MKTRTFLAVALWLAVAVVVTAEDDSTDKSPHKSAFITVNGVRLHYLDWGGQGETMLFLHGIGDTPHIYDVFAPKFTNQFRVLGLTRRGHGESEIPDSGYDTATRVEDIRQFLDALNIRGATLVGHSAAGNELSLFAITHPERATKLVYLDAAFYMEGQLELFERMLRELPEFFPSAADNESLDSIRRWYKRMNQGWSDAWEATLRVNSTISNPERRNRALTLMFQTEARPDHTKIKAPALMITVINPGAYSVKQLKNLPEERRKAIDDFLTEAGQMKEKEIELFRKAIPNGRVVMLTNADHHCFIDREDEVLREMRAFLAPTKSHSSVAADDREPVLTDAALRQILQRRINNKKAVGLVVGRIQGTNRSIVAAGTMALTNSRPVDGDTLFELGSITKVFTGILLADMANRGEVRPDDPATKYLPPTAKMPSRNGHVITLAHLASHRSGLPGMPENLAPADEKNPFADYTVEQGFEFLSSYKLPRDPGSAYEYSNLGIGLLGDLLARRAGTNYEQLVLDRICKPLGMHDTRIKLSPEMQERFATGHDGELNPAKHLGFLVFAGAGALRSTANDFLKFLAAVLNPQDDRVSKAILASQAARTNTVGPGGVGPGGEVAWGWFFNTLSDEIICHSGMTVGFHGYVGVNRKRDRAVVVFSNCSRSIDDIGLHLLEPRNELIPYNKAIVLDEGTLEHYVGTYTITPTLELTVSRERNRMYIQATHQSKQEIFALARDQFFSEGSPRFSFKTNASGMATELIALQAGKAHRAVRKNAPVDSRRPKMSLPPFVDLQIPLAPTPVKANGKQCLVYEIHITNFFTNKLELTRVEVFGERTNEPLASYHGEELTRQIAHVGFIDRAVADIAGLTVPSDQPDERIIGPGLRAVMFLLFTVEKETDIPRFLRHRLFFKPTAMSASDSEDVVEGAQINVIRKRPLVLGPPLRGEGWLAAGALSNTNYHRRSVFPLDGRGRARIAERFAIDWVKLGPSGYSHHDGYANTNASGYGEEVLAVANALVADVKDGIPENDPTSKENDIPLSLKTVLGNYVTLDLGKGRFACYVHLQPNSLRVRPGQKVRRGQVLGLLGNSGHSKGPHLHFHVVDANSLGAEGVPYVFESFEVQGVLPDLGGAWKPRPNAKTDKRRMEIPTQNAVIRFP